MSLYGTQTAFVNVAASATDAPFTGGQIPSAIAGKQVNVLAIAVVSGGTATTVTFNSKSGGAGTACSTTFQMGINGDLSLPYNPKGWFSTNAGEGLTVTTGAGATTGIQLTYEYV